jgi:Fe2+ or Zn2+ uptake regulation protein
MKLMPNSLFRKKNIRSTPQRLAVYRVLKEAHRNTRGGGLAGGHLTAEEIFGRIRKKFSGFSLATVYAILENFKKNDLISEVRIDPNCRRFELKKEAHHHLFCRSCRAIRDLLIPPCGALKNKTVAGHLIEDLHGYFYGLCQRCRRGVSKKCKK